MSDSDSWLPLAGGFAILAAVFAAARVLPRHWLANDLTRWYGARPRGAYFTFTRRDQLRRAGLSAFAAAALLGSSLLFFVLAERSRRSGSESLVLQAYFFITFILSCVALLAALLALGAAAFWRPRTIAIDDEGRHALANFLERMTVAERPPDPWWDFAAVRFDDDVAEEVRRELVSRLGPTARELSDDDRQQLGDAIERLRNAADPATE